MHRQTMGADLLHLELNRAHEQVHGLHSSQPSIAAILISFITNAGYLSLCLTLTSTLIRGKMSPFASVASLPVVGVLHAKGTLLEHRKP